MGRRMRVTLSHLSSQLVSSSAPSSAHTAAGLDVGELTSSLFFPEYAEDRERVFALLRDDPLFRLRYGLSLSEQRVLCHQRCLALAKSGLVRCDYLVSDPTRFFALLEPLSYHDPCTCVCVCVCL
jgi:hypothetical protein